MSLLLALAGGAGPTNYTLSGAAGSYSVTGVAATVARSRLVTAVAGAYAYTGVAATFRRNRVLSAEAGSYGVSGQAAAIAYSGGTPQQSYSAEVELRKWYVKRGKKVLLFNTAQDADDYLDSLEKAEQAIQQAQKTSRRARQRLRNKIVTVTPIQSVDIDQLSQAVAHFAIPVDLPNLIALQDFERVMQIMAMAMEMQDEEDIEMLLLM